MSFISEYQNAVVSHRMINIVSDPTIIIPHVYHYRNCEPSSFLHLAAGGSVNTDTVFYFSASSFPYYLLIATESGAGRISGSFPAAALPAGTLSVLDCSDGFSLRPAITPWNFRLFFFSGADLPVYGQIMDFKSVKIQTVSDYNISSLLLDSLSSLPEECGTAQLLSMHALLTGILTEIYFSLHPAGNDVQKALPAYLLQMKERFDFHFERPFSLSALEEETKISRYRLCREFSAAYGKPPLQYLNCSRIKAAKKMLLTSQLNVQEISSKIGFESVNHFINLFRSSTGTTPKAFRQAVLEGRSSPRCSAL